MFSGSAEEKKHDELAALNRVCEVLSDDAKSRFTAGAMGSAMVVKRDGTRQALQLSKIEVRLTKLKQAAEQVLGKTLFVEVWRIARNTAMSVKADMQTSDLDEHAAFSSSTIIDHYHYLDFAGIILADNLMKKIKAYNLKHFGVYSLGVREYVRTAVEYVDPQDGKTKPLLNYRVAWAMRHHADKIDAEMLWNNNYRYPYQSMTTLIKGQYLRCQYRKDPETKRVKFEPFETPQHALMRVAVSTFCDDVPDAEFDPEVHCHLQDAFAWYRLLSEQYGTAASPTLFNSGSNRAHAGLSSCFLLAMKEDSLDGIMDTLKDCAAVSKAAGGIGLHVHNIRASGSRIDGTNGQSNGLVPMLRVFNNLARYVDQGGGKRKGSFAIYLEPWHADLEHWLALKRPLTNEDEAARDLFYALWMSEVFLERMTRGFSQEEPVLWSFMDPKKCPGLSDVHGDDFKALYERYEREGRYERQVDIRQVTHWIFKTMIQTGTPYLLNKDACNRKSNQKNLGTIKSSNLCAEIVQYSSPEETGTCNLASVCLSRFVEHKSFNFAKLRQVVHVFVRALNRIIDLTAYPIESARRSNMRHRPIGLGIQGLAKTFALMGFAYTSPEAQQLNRDIAETMYFAAVQASHALTLEINPRTGKPYGPYPSIDENGGAPIRHGIFQNEMWKHDHGARWQPNPLLEHDFDDLRAKVRRDGVRNSLLIAHMPTASTSKILNNSKSDEPYFSIARIERTKHGEFTIICPEFIDAMMERGLWFQTDPETQTTHIPVLDALLQSEGASVQHIAGVPPDIKDRFATVYELKMSDKARMARDRAVWVCQSTSLNIHFRNQENLMDYLLRYVSFAYKLGLKTISYYLHTYQAGNIRDRSYVLGSSSSSSSTATEQGAEPGPSPPSPNQNPPSRAGPACSLSSEECVSCGA